MNIEENQIVDPFQTHGYKQGQELMIPADFLLRTIAFCKFVQESQPKVAALLTYPKVVNEISNKETGELERVDIEWAKHNPQSFANTAFSESGATGVVTELALLALQIQNSLVNLHINNINNGIAVEIKRETNDTTSS